jgi:apolipoprotein N-acyltransferase
LANQDAQLIVNLTNDSWYGTWQEPYQHLYMTLARAIEFRRPLIRATNTGISTVVLASGEVLEKSPMAREWTYIYDIPYRSRPGKTFYQICPWLLDGFLIITILLIVGKAFVGKSKKSRLV